MREAWHVFLPSRYKLSGLYECRGTNDQSCHEFVKMQDFYKCALVQYRGTNGQRSHKSVMMQKLYDVQLRESRYSDL